MKREDVIPEAITCGMPFVIKHYTADLARRGARPTIKGNGFDGLEIGESREEAEEFVAWVNARIAAPPEPALSEDIDALRRDVERYREALMCIEILHTGGLGDIAREALRMRCLDGDPEELRQKAENLRLDAERLTKANEELAKINVANLIEIKRLRDAQQKVLEWVDVIKLSYREERLARETRPAAEDNIKKICEQSLNPLR